MTTSVPSFIYSLAVSKAILSPPSKALGAITTSLFSIALTAFTVNNSLSPGPTPIPYNVDFILFYTPYALHYIYRIICYHHITLSFIFTYTY